MIKILRKSRGSVSKSKFFIDQKSIFRHFGIRNVKDGTQIRVCKINNESVIHLSQFISVKHRKI